MTIFIVRSCLQRTATCVSVARKGSDTALTPRVLSFRSFRRNDINFGILLRHRELSRCEWHSELKDSCKNCNNLGIQRPMTTGTEETYPVPPEVSRAKQASQLVFPYVT